MKILIRLFFIFFIHSTMFSIETVFDSVQWNVESSVKDISLFYNTDGKVSFFKAETIVDNLKSEEVIASLMDFKNYFDIFPKTYFFNPVKKYDDHRYIVYTKLDFFPLKKRDAFLDMSVNYLDKGILLNWEPATEYVFTDFAEDSVRAERIYGRWYVQELEDLKVKISVEYSNDWKVTNIPNSLLVSIQKTTTADALRNLLKYVKKNTGNIIINPQG